MASQIVINVSNNNNNNHNSIDDSTTSTGSLPVKFSSILISSNNQRKMQTSSSSSSAGDSPLQAFLRQQRKQQQEQAGQSRQLSPPPLSDLLIEDGGEGVEQQHNTCAVQGECDDDDEPLPLDFDFNDNNGDINNIFKLNHSTAPTIATSTTISSSTYNNTTNNNNNILRDAVDLALEQLGNDGDEDEQSLLDLDDVEEFFSDDLHSQLNDNHEINSGDMGHQHQPHEIDELHILNDVFNGSDNSLGMEDVIEFAPLAGSSCDDLPPYHSPLPTQGKPLVDHAASVEFANNMNNTNNINGLTVNSSHGSFSSLGSLTDAFSKLNHCMSRTSQTRDMVQRFSAFSASQPCNLIESTSDHSFSSLHSHQTTQSVQSANEYHNATFSGTEFGYQNASNRRQSRRRTKSVSKRSTLKKKKSSDLLGRSSFHGTTPVKVATLSSSLSSLSSHGSRPRRAYKSSTLSSKTSSRSSSYNSMVNDEEDSSPLVTGIAPINWG